MDTPLVVTGLGLTTCLGRGVETNWSALVRGESGLRPLRSIDVSASDVRDGGEIPDDGGAGALGEEPRDRALRELETVCAEALAAAEFDRADPPVAPERIGLALGSSLAASASSERFWRAFLAAGSPGAGATGADSVRYADLKSYDVEPQLDHLARRFGIAGGSVLVSNACAAGASSLVIAADWLRLGRVDVVLAAGFDLLDVHTFAGFRALGALTSTAMRPFGEDRAGMKLSDGFGALVLETEAHARSRGRAPIVRLVGYGESADAHNMTQPHPDGSGAKLAMRSALELAGLEPEAIDYVNAHATATPANDGAELRALRSVFGDALPRVAVHAVKPAVGHSLGGAGAVEAVITSLVVQRGFVPATLGSGERDPEALDLDLCGEPRARAVRTALTNSFGFGGCNSSLVFAGVEPS